MSNESKGAPENSETEAVTYPAIVYPVYVSSVKAGTNDKLEGKIAFVETEQMVHDLVRVVSRCEYCTGDSLEKVSPRLAHVFVEEGDLAGGASEIKLSKKLGFHFSEESSSVWDPGDQAELDDAEAVKLDRWRSDEVLLGWCDPKSRRVVFYSMSRENLANNMAEVQGQSPPLKCTVLTDGFNARQYTYAYVGDFFPESMYNALLHGLSMAVAKLSKADKAMLARVAGLT